MRSTASRRFATAFLVASGAVACAGSEGVPIDQGTGGMVAQVGGQSTGQVSGGTPSVGGRLDAAGGNSPGLGGAATGGATANTGGAISPATGGSPGAGGSAMGGAGKGGSNIGGGVSTGGANRGGSTATGGNASTGGASKGGTSTGGGQTTGGNTGNGGAGIGGAATGGASRGGAATGGAATGGTAAGGAATGGSTGACTPDWGTVPSNVSAWINESWNAQLGDNIRSRKAWLLDSIMMGKGQINLCVRWGATTAPSAAVKTGMAAAVQYWFNDWIKNLAGYGCFPYTTVTTKVTGWAVKPGNTGWVSDLGSDVKIYTEVDGEGEPKCSDSCSFFTNWTHTFPSCPGGEAFHHDYWLWLDDSIGGGAAAVGGDWGLRMPMSNFVSSMNKSNLVIEHEMGHGFAFQDYYDWTGSKPTGGSLMIVGSTSSQSPTTADMWLLRRTWKEQKALRGW